MKEIIGVYMLLNKNTNQFYIGSSKNIDRRFYQHRYNKDRMTTKLYNDMKNNDFDFIVLTECSVNELKQKEQELIDLLKPYYNTNYASRGIETNQADNYNEYHRLYLANVQEYNEAHKAACKKWNESHKDYFKRYYNEHKRSC